MPKIVRIDLPEGNEVVTTIQHKKTSKPPPPPPPPIGLIIVSAYLVFVVVTIARGQIPVEEPVPKPYPPGEVPCPPGEAPCPPGEYPWPASASSPQSAVVQPQTSSPQLAVPLQQTAAPQPAFSDLPDSSGLSYSSGQPIACSDPSASATCTQ